MTSRAKTSLTPVLGLAEAAERTGKSISTIRRKKGELLKLGTVITATGWEIPIAALVQLGLMDKVTPSDRASMTPAMTPHLITGDITNEISDLKIKLAAAEQRAEVAEAIANERTLRIDDLRQSLLMIEAAQGTATKKRRWWATN